jgi:anti-anti-sigma regulatory factor
MASELAVPPVGTTIGVCRVATHKHVTVAVLSADSPAAALPVAIAAAAAESPRVLVIDCIDMDALGPGACGEIVAACADLRASGCHLIVVNAPESEIGLLRAYGLDVAATTDRGFIDDPGIHPDREALHHAFPS